MPESNPQISGRSFAAEYIKEGNGYICELTATDPPIIVDGRGDTKNNAYEDAKQKAEKEIQRITDEQIRRIATENGSK